MYNNQNYTPFTNYNSTQIKARNPYFEQNISPFPQSYQDPKLNKDPYINTPFEDTTIKIRKNTISNYPFPRDSFFEEQIPRNSQIVAKPENKINKVTKIDTKKQNNRRYTMFDKNRGYINNNILKGKIMKDIFSEKPNGLRKSPMDDTSGNSSNYKNINTLSDINSENLPKNKFKKKVFFKDSDKSVDTNNNINNNQNKNLIINQYDQNNNKNQKNLVIEENQKNQFINRSISIFSMLKKIKFFQNLEQISQDRMKLFEKEFQKDECFKKRDFFNNVFIKNFEIDIAFPLTLIFYYVLNPETQISQFSLNKNFYETVLQLHGYNDIKINYNKNNLEQVPKYFKDLKYVIKLFNDFDKNELNNFINEIKNWIKIFQVNISYKDNSNNSINDEIKVYFISPNDLTVEYKSCSEGLSQSFAEFNCHCDIEYDKKLGRLSYKATVNVYNKTEELHQYEFLGEIWERAMIVINDESQKNKLIQDKKFKENLKKSLNKYSNNINYIIKDIIDKEKKADINQDNLMNKDDSNEININKISSNETNKDDKNINKEAEKNINKNITNKTEEKLIDKNMKKNKINNSKDKTKERILFYGVLLSFFLFIFKTVLSIELGTISLDTFFNFLIIIVIGFMLYNNKIFN